MVEEMTADAVTLDDITSSFRSRISNEIALLETTVRQATWEVNRFLKGSAQEY